MKTWKKIEETKRRATDVVKAKMVNEERSRRKAMAMQEEAYRQEMHRQQLAAMRANRENEKQKIRDAVVLQKQEEAKQTKFIDQQQKATHRQQAAYNMREKEFRNRSMKQQERIQRVKVEEFRK